jgi:hypothetical protein
MKINIHYNSTLNIELGAQAAASQAVASVFRLGVEMVT